MNKEPEKIACEVCKKLIPRDAAITHEGMDYTLHFCDIKCLDYWKEEQKKKTKGKAD